jgi:MraZ protein
MMPNPLKKQLNVSLQEGFVLKRSVFQQCLELYPMKEWDLMMQKINKLNRFVKKNNDFIRRFTAGVRIIEIDATGRLLIPKDLGYKRYCIVIGSKYYRNLGQRFIRKSD